MNADDTKRLAADADGLSTYEYLANHALEADEADIEALVANLQRVDLSGQFLASAARYLHAISPERFAKAVEALTATVIDRDRERRYMPDLLTSLYGDDYDSRAAELSAADNNFRRMYKRVHPTTSSL